LHPAVDQVKPTPSNDQQSRSVGEACGLSSESEAPRRKSPVTRLLDSWGQVPTESA